MYLKNFLNLSFIVEISALLRSKIRLWCYILWVVTDRYYSDEHKDQPHSEHSGQVRMIDTSCLEYVMAVIEDLPNK